VTSFVGQATVVFRVLDVGQQVGLHIVVTPASVVICRSAVR
jgi:hypothetical protein